jgi:hypothetical protein
MKISNCCNAPMIENTDLCSKCKEHSVDGFDEAMKVQGKDVIYNGKLVKDKYENK